MSEARIILKSGRDRSVRNRHPQVFSGAVARVSGEPQPGDWVAVSGADGPVLGWGFYNPKSRIPVRLFAFSAESPDPEELIKSRIFAALAYRDGLRFPAETDCMRLINAEGDGLGGLIVDAYAGHLVVQPLAFWAQKHLDTVLGALDAALATRGGLSSVRLRVEKEAAEHEGLTLESGPWPVGADAPGRVRVRELGLSYDVDLEGGQKTGFFLDQRDNRWRVRDFCARARVLNLFCYTGGFSLNALAGGAAEVVSVDSSAPALAILESNLAANGFTKRARIERMDVKRLLPEYESKNERFDVVICDPPPLARRAAQTKKAARAYKDINRRAMKLLDGGRLMTFTCSPFIDSRLFRQIVFAAAVEAGRQVRVLATLGAGEDHPVSLYHPEGDYLNGLLLQVER